MANNDLIDEDLKNRLIADAVKNMPKDLINNDTDDTDDTEDLDDDLDTDDALESDIEEEDETQPTEDEDDLTDTKGKKVPLNKYVEEKKKRQQVESETLELKAKLAEYQAKEQDAEIENYKSTLKQRFIAKEMDGDYADIIAEELAKLKKDMRGSTTEQTIDKETIEITKLKSESSYYDDADSYAKEIKDKMKKLSISAKEAYNMIVDPVTRNKEILQRERAKNNGASTTPKQSSSSSSSAQAKMKSSFDKFTPEDKIAAKELRALGWDNARIAKNLGYR